MPDCGFNLLQCGAQKLLGGAANAAVRWGVDGAAEAAREAAQWVTRNSLGWWMGVGSVDLQGSAATRIRALVMVLAAVVATCGVMWCGVRMAWTRKGGEAVSDLMTGVLRFAVITASAFTLLQVLLRGGDWFSSAALDKAAGEAISAKMATIGGLAGITQPWLVILLGTVTALAGLGQFFLMAFREAGIVVLAGVLALAAAGGFNPATKAWFPKVSGWLAGLVFYKPMVALTYAAALYMIGDTSDVRMVLVGIAMMLLSLVALPVMIRFFSWAAPAGVSAMSGGSGVAAVGGIATTAMMLRAAGGGGAVEHARFMEQSNPLPPPSPSGSGSAVGGGGPDFGGGNGGPGPTPGGPAPIPAGGPAAGGSAAGVNAGAAAAGPAAPVLLAADAARQALDTAKDKTAGAMGVHDQGETK